MTQIRWNVYIQKTQVCLLLMFLPFKLPSIPFLVAKFLTFALVAAGPAAIYFGIVSGHLLDLGFLSVAGEDNRLVACPLYWDEVDTGISHAAKITPG